MKSVLRMNNYPRSFVYRVYRASPHPKPSRDDSPGNSIVIPYVKSLSEALQCILSEANAKVFVRPHTNLRQQLVHLKDLVPTMNRANVVHSIPCSFCSYVYVGLMSRILEARIQEQSGSKVCED